MRRVVQEKELLIQVVGESHSTQVKGGSDLVEGSYPQFSQVQFGNLAFPPSEVGRGSDGAVTARHHAHRSGLPPRAPDMAGVLPLEGPLMSLLRSYRRSDTTSVCTKAVLQAGSRRARARAAWKAISFRQL